MVWLGWSGGLVESSGWVGSGRAWRGEIPDSTTPSSESGNLFSESGFPFSDSDFGSLNPAGRSLSLFP